MQQQVEWTVQLSSQTCIAKVTIMNLTGKSSTYTKAWYMKAQARGLSRTLYR